MQRKRPPPAQRQIWTILLILALLVLFVLTVGASCTANPYLYGGRGLVVFLPASTPGCSSEVISITGIT